MLSPRFFIDIVSPGSRVLFLILQCITGGVVSALDSLSEPVPDAEGVDSKSGDFRKRKSIHKRKRATKRMRFVLLFILSISYPPFKNHLIKLSMKSDSISSLLYFLNKSKKKCIINPKFREIGNSAMKARDVYEKH